MESASPAIRARGATHDYEPFREQSPKRNRQMKLARLTQSNHSTIIDIEKLKREPKFATIPACAIFRVFPKREKRHRKSFSHACNTNPIRFGFGLGRALDSFQRSRGRIALVNRGVRVISQCSEFFDLLIAFIHNASPIWP